MKTLKLTIWERLQLIQCIPAQDTVANIRRHLRLMDRLELSEDEKAEAGFVVLPDGSARWDARAGAVERAIDFEDADFDHLVSLVQRRNNWPTAQDILTLIDKIEQAQKGE